jgi:hypothetical protein
MRPLTIDDFAPRRGKAVRVKAAGGQVLEMKLVEVQALPSSVREGGAFRLEFHGPLQPILPQATYRFDLGGEGGDIFIVPLGQTPQATRYEAIFY